MQTVTFNGRATGSLSSDAKPASWEDTKNILGTQERGRPGAHTTCSPGMQPGMGCEVLSLPGPVCFCLCFIIMFSDPAKS